MLHAPFLIGVDSDGTAFDSMNPKHLEAFIPAALEIWPLSPGATECFSRVEKQVNLFSGTRGINRFPGLPIALDLLAEEYPAEAPDREALRAYIAGESKYSPATLARWTADHPSPELDRVLAWSRRADELFAAACEGIQPFPGVRDALCCAARGAAVAVISSAALSGLRKDWEAGGLTPFVDFLMSQEDGSKTAQLQLAMKGCEAPVQALMLGDTEGDGQAAHEAGARFYPILPGREEESWKRFREEILPLFLSGGYTAQEEEKYAAPLREMLS